MLGQVLRHIRGGQGIPEMTWAGTEGDSNIMVMDLLGALWPPMQHSPAVVAARVGQQPPHKRRSWLRYCRACEGAAVLPRL